MSAPVADTHVAATRFPRTHERLQRDITRDPIFLFQERRIYWHPEGPYAYDGDLEALIDDDGDQVSPERGVEEGHAVWTWDTVTVFLTREDGEAWGESRSYRFRHGWRVYCVAAHGDLIDVLASATEGGRYT